MSTLVPGPPPGWKSADGASEPPNNHNRWMLVRPDETGVSIEQTWQAMAVRASMSNDVVLEELFIPEERAPVDKRPAPHQSWLPDGAAALRVPSRSRPWMPAMMLGVAEAALNETIEFAKPRAMSVGGQPRTSMPGNQFAVADAAMAIESGRAFLHQEGAGHHGQSGSGGRVHAGRHQPHGYGRPGGARERAGRWTGFSPSGALTVFLKRAISSAITGMSASAHCTQCLPLTACVSWWASTCSAFPRMFSLAGADGETY